MIIGALLIMFMLVLMIVVVVVLLMVAWHVHTWSFAVLLGSMLPVVVLVGIPDTRLSVSSSAPHGFPFWYQVMFALSVPVPVAVIMHSIVSIVVAFPAGVVFMCVVYALVNGISSRSNSSRS